LVSSFLLSFFSSSNPLIFIHTYLLFGSWENLLKRKKESEKENVEEIPAGIPTPQPPRTVARRFWWGGAKKRGHSRPPSHT
jgi:hypothetical protein